MNRKTRFAGAFAVILVITMGVGGVLSRVAAADAPENIVMKSPVFEKHTRAIVTFSHAKHAKDYKIPCTDCHHVFKDGKNVWKEGDKVQKCTECHKKARAPRAKKGEPRMSKADRIRDYYYSAIHENCRVCHKVEKKKGKNAPTRCVECHPRKK